MLLFAAAALATPSPPQPRVAAIATVRIERAVRVGSEEWERVPKGAGREVVVRDEDGREMLLRLIELQ